MSSKNHEHDEHEEMQIPLPEMPDGDGPIWVNKFSEDHARVFVKQLQQQAMRDPSAPIIVYIDSFGGDAYALLTMISAMESVPNQIITCALSKAMSAGALLLSCGDIRYASPHTSIMIHEVSAGTVGHIDDISIQHENLLKMNERLMKMLVKKCNIKGGLPALKKLLTEKRDLYLDADEAVKFGIVDHIGVPTLHRALQVQHVVVSNPRGQQQDAKKAKS